MDEWAPGIPQAVRSELPPYGMKPHWVTFGFSTPANRLYDLYNAHVDRGRGDLVVWPTLDELAKMMGLSRGDKVTPYMRELEHGGAISVETVTKTGGKGRRYIVTLKVHPPAGFTGPLQTSDWYDANRAGKPGKTTMADRARGSEEIAGDEVPPLKGVYVPPADGVYVPPADGEDVHPAEGVVTNNHLNQNQKNQEDAPSARSAADVRRTGAGSSARANGGSAAPSRKLRLTKEQRTALRAVEAALPRPLLAQLPGQRIPGNNHRAVLAALDARTPEQIAGRIERRWVGWGFEPAFHDGQIRNPIGAAMALLGPTPYCPDPSCEDGVMVDTGAECRACVERRANRRAAYNRGEDPRRAGGAAAPRPECVDCGRPLVGDVLEDGMCRRCRQAPVEALAALKARWAAEDAARAETEALYAEAARRREQRAANPQTTQHDGPPPF
ncbi:hypothetical protein ABTX60_06805 [Streptomyces sp. NPDC126510]|uniref:hypothetical protein n=1 Tax=Streptomyces sp. NPDC126510 TaxID=3155317 RepID=UPI00331A0F35